jgi:hypothetical protein
MIRTYIFLTKYNAEPQSPQNSSKEGKS